MTKFMQNFRILCRIWSRSSDSWGRGPKSGVLGVLRDVKISLRGRESEDVAPRPRRWKALKGENGKRLSPSQPTGAFESAL